MIKPRTTALVICSLVLCAALAAGQQKQHVRPGLADPEVIDAAGDKEALAKHAGKLVMVNFWATWCEPCRSEYPVVNEMAKKYGPQGLVVLGIGNDDDAEMGLVRSFLRRNMPVFTNYRMKPGMVVEFNRAVDPTWRGALPSTFFYNRDGRLVGRLVGEQTRESFEKAIQSMSQSDKGVR